MILEAVAPLSHLLKRIFNYFGAVKLVFHGHIGVLAKSMTGFGCVETRFQSMIILFIRNLRALAL